MMLGMLTAALLIITISFKNNTAEVNGKFQAAVGEKGVLILDTETGAYIIAPDVRDFGKVQWVKGDFMSTFKVSKDNKKE